MLNSEKLNTEVAEDRREWQTDASVVLGIKIVDDQIAERNQQIELQRLNGN
jgi:hypothetical protein